MNQTTSRIKKTFLLIASIMMIAGLIMAAIGFFTGAKLNIGMGNHGITIIGNSGGTTLKTQNGLKLNAFTSVDGKIADSNVHFVPSDHFGMDLSYYSDDSKPLVTVNNGVLQITQNTPENNTWFQISFNPNDVKASEITVYFPKGIHLEKWNLKDDNGNVDASDFSAQSTNINCEYGHLTLKNSSFGDCTVYMGNGDSSLTSVHTDTLKFENEYGGSKFDSIQVSGSGETTIDASNGKISMSNCKIPTLALSNSYGNIELSSLETEHLNAKQSDGKLQILDSNIKDAHVKNSYGSVKATGLTLSDSEIQCENGSISLDGLLKGKTTLHSDYGGVSVQTSLPQSQYRCDFSTEYGKVTVNGKKYGKGVSMPVNAPNSLDVTANNGDVTAQFQTGVTGKTA